MSRPRPGSTPAQPGPRSVTRQLPACSLLAALLALGLAHTGALAQGGPQHEALLQDTDRVRGALPSVVLNAVLHVEGRAPTHLRLRLDAGGAVRIAPDDDSLPEALRTAGTQPIAERLLAAALARGPLADALDGIGLLRLDGEPRLVPLPAAPAPTLEPVWQIDGRNGALLLEPGTARLRGITLRRSDGLWQLEVLDFAEVASGWLPGTLRVTHDDRTILTLRITDAAPTASNLAPLPATDGPPPRTPFPRLPL